MQEVEQLRQKKQEIDQELRAFQESSMGSVQNFPTSRRSDRGYSSDIESVRSGRGGPRGRGRGRGGGSNTGGGNRGYQGKEQILTLIPLEFTITVTGRRGPDDDDYNSRGDHRYNDRNSGGGYRGGPRRNNRNSREQNGREHQYYNHSDNVQDVREQSSVERGL